MGGELLHKKITKGDPLWPVSETDHGWGRTYPQKDDRYPQGMNGREDLQGGETKIEAFLTHLAVDKGVAPSTQNQAMNALVFLYKQVLKQPLDP